MTQMVRISPVSNPFRHTILCRLDTDAKDECSNSLDLHTTMGMRMKMKTSIALLFRLQYHCTVVRSKWFKINGFVLLIMAFVGETFCGRLVLRLVGTVGSWFPCWAPGEIKPKIFNNHVVLLYNRPNHIKTKTNTPTHHNHTHTHIKRDR